MEDRGFKELNISPCSYQKRDESKGSVKAPPLALYRNNLTALSQCRNLLFIACVDKIYIYKPQFPTQIIPSKPELIIDIPKSHRGLRGHIDPTKPHAVNQLAIGDLGNEEIIVTVCDDGDVVVYTTRSICSVIEQNILQDGVSLKPAIKIKTLLLKNVGMSAWGVAIHKAARLIAVSSNRHQISVFAFALSQDSSLDSQCGSDDDSFSTADYLGPADNLWERVDKADYSPLQRSSKNVELILKGHENNIPNIAFCNTKTDLIGQYLASTDVTGSIFVWDIWQRRIIADLSSHKRFTKALCGWGIACLDPQTYHLANSVKETFGCDKEEMENTMCTPCVTYDNTANSHSVANSSQRHPYFSKYRVASVVSPTQSTLEESDLSNGSVNSDDEEISEDNEEIGEDNEDFDADDDENVDVDVQVDMNENGGEETQPETNPQAFSRPAGSIPPSKDGNAFTASTAPNPLQAINSEQYVKTSALPFDIFTTTEFDIRFLFNVQLDEDNKYPMSYHSVICKEALHQEIPPMLRHINHFERLNMIIQIPEISVIIVANQLGRVALLTMTKSAKTHDQHGFRIDWILPFRTQEDQNLRSEFPLVGMAAGPVQNREMMPGGPLGTQDDSLEMFSADAHHRHPALAPSRRYRLFLFYCDHSILTYEFWRSSFSSRYSGIREKEDLLF